MKITQSNYLNMSSAVLTPSDSNRPVWIGIPVALDSVGRLRKTLTDMGGRKT
jgi:hypothetical protein